MLRGTYLGMMENVIRNIKYIGNYYGGLSFTEKDGKFYWIIENYDTHMDNIDEWSEIPESLYKELLNQPNYVEGESPFI